jgi:hypothetical protein
MNENTLEKENLNKNNYLESKKQVVKNNYWNENHELLLESLQKSCFRLSKEYKQKYFKLRDKLQWYRIPIIIISSIGGFLSLSNSGYIPQLYNKWVSLFVGFTNLTVTIISLIESFKKIDTRMNGSYTTYVNFQKLHDEISIIKRIPPNERDTNGNDTVNNLFSKYETFFADAPIIRKLINDDIGFNELEEIQTPKISKPICDIESQMIEMRTKLDKINSKNNKHLFDFKSKNKKDNLSKTNFKSKYNYENFYNSYNYENNNNNNNNNKNNIHETSYKDIDSSKIIKPEIILSYENKSFDEPVNDRLLVNIDKPNDAVNDIVRNKSNDDIVNNDKK